MLRPRTLEEARRYRYGRWSGNEKGVPLYEGRCIQEFFPNGRGAIPRQCARPQANGRPWCRVHDPEIIAAKRSADATKRAEVEKAQDALKKRAGTLFRRLRLRSAELAYDSNALLYVDKANIPLAELEKLAEALRRAGAKGGS